MAAAWRGLAAALVIASLPVAAALGQPANDAAIDRTRPAASNGAPAAAVPPAVPVEASTEAAVESDTPAVEALPPGLDVATVERVIEVLEDETRRQQVLDTLRTLTATEAPPSPTTGMFEGPMEWLRGQIDRRADHLLDTFDGVVSSLDNVGEFGAWLTEQYTRPLRREFWSRTLTDIGLVLGISVVVSLVVLRLLRPARRVFQTYQPPTPFHLIVGIALHVALRLVPVAIFAGTAIAVGAALELGPFTRAVAIALVQGLAFVTALTATIRAILNYKNPHMRLLPLEADTGAALQRGLIRVVAVGGYGYFGLEAARALGLPWTLHAFLLHVLFLATFLLYVRLVFRFRSEGTHGFEVLATTGTAGLLGRFLPWDKVAGIWHWGAILFGLAIYGSWAMDVPGGPLFLLRAMLVTIGILIASRLIHVWLGQDGDAPTVSRAEDGEEQDLNETLAAVAQSPMTFFWRLLTTVMALTLILQVWGVGLIGHLMSEAGRDLRNALTTIGMTLLGSFVVWKLVGSVIRGFVDEKDTLGRPIRSNRSRTLLTISRNLLFVLIWITAGLTVLSELGVNLAPLLAGAGVIGLAIGFGAQQLVRDVITGFFILIEDTVSVGDVAELGGKAGVVEAVSLRTVRLRSYDGQVHTIPYSSIDTISNFTKEFSYYVFDVGVGYKEDTDRVIAVMREIGAELQRERPYRRLILEPLDVAGVDRFADSAVVIRARIKTRPLQQWTVGREFNRRLKQRFDALGIEIPFPQRTLHMVQVPGAPASAPPPDPRSGVAAS